MIFGFFFLALLASPVFQFMADAATDAIPGESATAAMASGMLIMVGGAISAPINAALALYTICFPSADLGLLDGLF